MNKYQKELIEKCEPYEVGTPFDNLYIIPSGKLYNGFWGKNGYNKIYLVCGVHEDNEDKFYLVGKKHQVDVLDFGDYLKQHTLTVLSCDIPNKLNCVRLFHLGRKKFVIRDVLSTVTIEEIEIK